MMGTLNAKYYSDSSDEFSGFQVTKGQIPPTWILLDSQLTLNLFKNADLLIRIKTVDNQANVNTYVGMGSTKQTGYQTLFNLDTWFDLHSIEKIFSITIVTKHYPAAFNTAENFFTFHFQDKEITFRQSEGVQYYFNTAMGEDFDINIFTYIVGGTPKETCLLIMVA